MSFKKPVFRYFCVSALPDLLLALAVLHGRSFASASGAVLEPLFLLTLLPGGVFALGLVSGAAWGGVPGLRWRWLLPAAFATLLLFPFPYFLRSFSEPELFWLGLGYFSGQKAVGFLMGGWLRMGWGAATPCGSVEDSECGRNIPGTAPEPQNTDGKG